MDKHLKGDFFAPTLSGIGYKCNFSSLKLNLYPELTAKSCKHFKSRRGWMCVTMNRQLIGIAFVHGHISICQ